MAYDLDVHMWSQSSIPVIDLFAGPGGLGEGFSRAQLPGYPRFRLAMSVECDSHAHTTLELRAFCRAFTASGRQLPSDYFEFLDGRCSRQDLFHRHPAEAHAAGMEAVHAQLGVPADDQRIAHRLAELDRSTDLTKSVMIGGPPCQAYSIVGRSRRSKAEASGIYREDQDSRHVLYREYLRLIERIRPAAFVMENVRGILSAKYKGSFIFAQILSDLREAGYDLHALGPTGSETLFADANPYSFLLMASDYGIPQRRARVFIVGTRSDLRIRTIPRPNPISPELVPTVENAIGTLPRLRSGLSFDDSDAEWKRTVRHAAVRLARESGAYNAQFSALLEQVAGATAKLPSARTALVVPTGSTEDRSFVLNHETRGHITEDLERYLFYSCWGKARGVSPTLLDLPSRLLPQHRNVQKATATAELDSVGFVDRFRVQIAHQPSTTITSHIAKDGHYFIHPDPFQCRSLSVREAARLQTFPDDYFFCGPRTEQYHQVGNAVPPLLAQQIAQSILAVLCG